MTLRFLDRAGEKYRVLASSPAGLWLISFDHPAAPFFVCMDDLQAYQRIPTPPHYLAEVKGEKTKAQLDRLELITPLLCNEKCITSRAIRLEMAKKIANAHHTTSKRILRLYFRYLATGTLFAKKPDRPLSRNETYDWAIRTFYYSSKRLSLRAAYEMMLVERFTEANGKLSADAPSWSGFQHYFYKHGYHKKPQKIIAREGLSHYQRNYRQLHGSASDWRSQLGCFQMDATIADIYLVSRLDRSSVIGRPNIYLAVDTATQLIAGIYVGMEAGEGAVMACLANAASDKVNFCKKYGIALDPVQWPSCGVPDEIITDQGREFTGERMNEFCTRYGTELQVLPPFRPDRKGIVEKTFDLLQSRYKPLLRGKGVIEPDAQERWATDYRSQAVLNLDEFTAIVLHCVIYLNSGRCLSDGKTPAQRWLHSEKKLLETDPEEIYRIGLQRTTAKMTRKGIRFNNMYYIPQNEALLISNGDNCTIAYDTRDISRIHVIKAGAYHLCKISGTLQKGICQVEWDTEKCRQREVGKAAQKQQITAEVKLTCELQGVIAKANKRKEGLVY